MKLPTRMVEKPWGRDCLPAPFMGEKGKRIGEIWFEPSSTLNELLVKYLFTSEKLSIQVHPPVGTEQDSQCGKEECWLVLEADPGAVLGIGFAGPISGDAMRAAALDGSIERLLTWYPVKAGDFFYIPAGTVHAIGGGVSLIEVQLNCDVTYRLYDYGRPRALNLDEGIGVARGQVYDPALHKALPVRGSVSLVDGPYFRLDRIEGLPTSDCVDRYAGAPVLVIPLVDSVVVDGQRIESGECAVASAITQLHGVEGAMWLLAQPCKSSDMLVA